MLADVPVPLKSLALFSLISLRANSGFEYPEALGLVDLVQASVSEDMLLSIYHIFSCITHSRYLMHPIFGRTQERQKNLTLEWR